MKTYSILFTALLIVSHAFAIPDTVAFDDESALKIHKAKHGQLNIMIDGIETNSGTLKVMLYNQDTGFPFDHWNAMYNIDIAVEEEGNTVVFKSIPYGKYALYVYHDENSNGKFDKNWTGAAKEKYGYSNMNGGKRVVPLFSQSAFDFEKDGSQLIIELIEGK
jgi:uncharacterized protein (DUF2141 family)